MKEEENVKKEKFSIKKNLKLIIVAIFMFVLGICANNGSGNSNIIPVSYQNTTGEAFSAYEQKTKEYETTINSKDSIIKKYEEEVFNLKSEKSKLEENNLRLESEKKDLEEKVNTLNSQNESLKKNVKTVSTNTKSSSNQKTTATNSNSYMVYVTKTGGKYHKSGCKYLSKSKIAISKSSAIFQGYGACSICNP